MNLIKNEALRYAILALIGVILALYNPMVETAADYNQDILKAGAGVYATIRVTSGVMNYARDLDITGSVAVASITNSPGQMLTPVINTLDRMANLLFALMISSGVLSFTLPIVGKLGAIILIASAAARASMLLLRLNPRSAVNRGAGSAIMLGVLACICIPGAYAAAFVIGDSYTASAWESAEAAFNSQADQLEGVEIGGIDLEDATEPVPQEPAAGAQQSGNALDWALGGINGAVEGSTNALKGALEASTRFANAVKNQASAGAAVLASGVQSAGAILDASIDIGVAYLVKLIFLPILILLGMAWILRSVSGSQTLIRYEDGTRSNVRYVESDKGALDK